MPGSELQFFLVKIRKNQQSTKIYWPFLPSDNCCFLQSCAGVLMSCVSESRAQEWDTSCKDAKGKK